MPPKKGKVATEKLAAAPAAPEAAVEDRQPKKAAEKASAPKAAAKSEPAKPAKAAAAAAAAAPAAPTPKAEKRKEPTHPEEPVKKPKSEATPKDKDQAPAASAPKITQWWCTTDEKLIKNLLAAVRHVQEDTKVEKELDWVDWEVVAGDDMTAEEAKKRWHSIFQSVSRKRTLLEIVEASQRAFHGAKLTKNILSPEEFQTVRKKSSKNKEDDDRPKRPSTSYLMWAETQRAQVREQGEVRPGEVSRILGERWAKLSDKEKAKWVKKADAAREEFHEKMKEYLETHPESVRVSDLKLIQDPNAPKRPERSSFLLYCAETRDSLDAEGFGDRQRALTEGWKALSKAEKEEWSKKLAVKQAAYEAARKDYLEGLSDAERKLFFTSEQVKDRNKMPQKPSAFMFYAEDHRAEVQEDNSDLDAKEIEKKLRQDYKALSAEERKEYLLKAKAALPDYHKACLEHSKIKEEGAQKKRKAADKAEEKEDKPAKAKKSAAGTSAGAAAPAAKGKASLKTIALDDDEEDDVIDMDEEEEAEVEVEEIPDDDEEPEPEPEEEEAAPALDETADLDVTIAGKHKHTWTDDKGKRLSEEAQDALADAYKAWKKAGKASGAVAVEYDGKHWSLDCTAMTIKAKGSKVAKSIQRSKA